MSEPRRWFLPGGVGAFYDGKEVFYAIGPDPQSALLPNPGGTEVVEAEAYDKLTERLAEAEKVLEFYGDAEKYKPHYHWLKPGEEPNTKPEIIHGDFGRRAREYFEKYKAGQLRE